MTSTSVVTAGERAAGVGRAGARLKWPTMLWLQAHLALLVALVAAGPLLLLPNRGWPVGLLLVAPLLWLLARSVASAAPWPARLADAAALGLLGMGVAGTAVSGDASASLPKLLGLAYATAAYGAVRQYVTSAQRARTVVLLLSAAGLAIALVGFVGTAWLIYYAKAQPLVALYQRLPHLITAAPSAHGTIAGFHPNEVAGVLAMLVPISALALLPWPQRPTPTKRSSQSSVLGSRFSVLGSQFSVLSSQPAGRPGLFWDWHGRASAAANAIAAAALLCMAAYIGISVSRTAWLALVVAAAAVVIAALANGVRRRWLAALALAAACAGSLVVYTHPATAKQVFSASDFTWEASTWGQPTRLETWERSLEMIRDHPVAGIGLNMFPYVVQTQYPYSHDNDVLMPHAHNLYLQTGVEYGLPGLACFAALVGVACAGLIRSLRSARFGRALPLGIGGALVAYLNFGLLDTVAVGAKPTFLAWTVLALAVSSGWPASEPSATQVPAMVPFRSG